MPALRETRGYRLLLLAVTVACAALLWRDGADALARAIPATSEDHWRYWAGWRLASAGRDPYLGEGLEALRTAIPGLGHERIGLFTPPWALALMAPFAALPYAASHLAWLLASIALVLVSASAIWRAYEGRRELLPVALAVAALAFPTLLTLRLGQIDPWVLLGVAGFLHLADSRRSDVLAGACLALMAVKPQLFVGVWVACVAWIVTGRRWRVAVGLAGAMMAGTLLVAVGDPAVVGQFLRSSAVQPPAEWRTPTLGCYLRLALGPGRFWLQGIAPALVALFSAVYWALHRRDFTWRRDLPVLLWASVLGAAYAWTYDQVVLLVPILAATAALLRRGWTRAAAAWLGALALLTCATALLHSALTDEAFAWLAPALLAWTWAARRAAAEPPPAAALDPAR